MFLQPVDFILIMIGFCALWGIAECHNVLKKILWELNPRKRPIRGVKRSKV